MKWYCEKCGTSHQNTTYILINKGWAVGYDVDTLATMK